MEQRQYEIHFPVTALKRDTAASFRPAVRIVHIGLGAFFRAHAAWYTEEVDPAGEWGIAGFTGRTAGVAERLQAQDGLYTLVERSETGDSHRVVGALAEAHSGTDLARLCALVAAPSTSIITLTVTEAGYSDAGPADGATTDGTRAAGSRAPTSAMERLVLALAARRDAGSGGLAVMPLDNVRDSGQVARSAVLAVAGRIDTNLAAWIDEEIAFVSSSVDRITPRTTSADIDGVLRATGLRDAAPVVTEPFHDWVICGSFPAGRPQWEKAGVQFVDDITPFDSRKLWLLNGAHCLLAYAGLARGYRTVAEAIGDRTLAGWVDEYWDAAGRALPEAGLDLADYRRRLSARFANPRIAHELAQIAQGGLDKLRVRIVPIVVAERAAGASGSPALRVLAAWIVYLRALSDPAALPEEVRDALALPLEGCAAQLALALNPDWANDLTLLTDLLVAQAEVGELATGSPRHPPSAPKASSNPPLHRPVRRTP
jgi:fructuronate reductase